MDLHLKGRRAAVAAASRGLGFAAAEALAAEGCDVAICGRDLERIGEAADRIGNDCKPIVADVSDPDQAARFVRDARDVLGGLDILVPNAGGPPAGTFETTALEEYPKAFTLNAMSVIAMCHEAIPAMVAQGWGRVVAITSVAVKQPIGTLILSNTARAGVTGFLKTVSTDVAHAGVTVNSVLPGFHVTERLTEVYGDDLAGLAESIPAKTVGKPADLGAIVAFLCSEQAEFVTGAALQVDGGSYAGLY